jgi:hypothetical protein
MALLTAIWDNRQSISGVLFFVMFSAPVFYKCWDSAKRGGGVR